MAEGTNNPWSWWFEIKDAVNVSVNAWDSFLAVKLAIIVRTFQNSKEGYYIK